MRLAWTWLLLVCCIASAHAQQDSLQLANEAAEFQLLAMKGLRADKRTYFGTMAPTLEECRLVFKGAAADLVFRNSRNGLDAATAQPWPAFVDFKTGSFTTAELGSHRDFFAADRREFRAQLLPGLRLYEVQYLHPEGNLTLRFFLKVNGRWVFFANPWLAFRQED
jgi:hypothetical protein